MCFRTQCGLAFLPLVTSRLSVPGHRGSVEEVGFPLVRGDAREKYRREGKWMIFQ